MARTGSTGGKKLVEFRTGDTRRPDLRSRQQEQVGGDNFFERDGVADRIEYLAGRLDRVGADCRKRRSARRTVVLKTDLVRLRIDPLQEEPVTRQEDGQVALRIDRPGKSDHKL